MADELEQLQNAATAIDAEAAAAADPGAPEAEAVPVDMGAEIAALLQTVAGILTPAFPCLAEIYTEPTCQRLGGAAAPVMDKYGLSVGGLFDRWGAEITLAAVAFPVAVATAKGIKADMDARRNAPREVNPAPSNYAAERATDEPTL